LSASPRNTSSRIARSSPLLRIAVIGQGIVHR
jgi:hypothetical protein